MDASDQATIDGVLVDALRASGHRVTVPRLLVHRCVRAADRRHLTPEQVHTELAAELPGLSPATVYATLELLEELGFVRRLSTPQGVAVYDSRPDHHHHLVCRECGSIADIDAPVRTAAAERAAQEAGFQVDRAELQLTGLCASCAAAATARARH